jgi:hypothetical protein
MLLSRKLQSPYAHCNITLPALQERGVASSHRFFYGAQKEIMPPCIELSRPWEKQSYGAEKPV